MSNLQKEVTTPSGKKLELRELDPGDTLDLIEMAGTAMQSASAGPWIGYAQMVCSVEAIDGVPVMMPSTKEQIKQLARRIGNDGMLALQAIFYPKAASDGGGAASPNGVDMEAAKN
ncbi:putative phage protein [Acetobacter orientalis]|uniref:Putative phage protein n=1 Tax=Acetobacter orientalis TaxID=146474 RepID=A0A2Z5ZKX2_9PROT|nr:putative phage protein [Acetobacter orientalis]